MRKNHIALALAVAFPASFSIVFPVVAQTGPQTATPATSDAPVRSLGTVTVNSGRPTSLPTQIPTTIEGVVREQIERTVNAFDAEDALKYLPSLTYADAKITANDKNPASVGKRAPRVPDWRASFVATYKPNAQWSGTVGVRYSGEQFGQLDNSDTNGSTYQGVSSYLVADVRARYQFAKQWSASFGIDNLNNATYWAFHPYTQCTYVAERKFDL